MKLPFAAIDILLGTIWLLIFRYCQYNSAKDPSSVFFNPHAAYTPTYSAIREREAEDYILNVTTAVTPLAKTQGSGAPATVDDEENANNLHRICVGIPSVVREREQFLQRTLGSLVDTVTARAALDIVVLLADSDPRMNEAYGQPWLSNIADEILVYAPVSDDLAAEGYRHIKPDPGFATAERNMHVQIDYANVLDTCRSRNADYFVLLEDDVVASRDWFTELQQSLSVMEETNHGKDWMYLRLFYTEYYMGWNNEEWPQYLMHIAMFYAIAATLTMFVRRAWQSIRRQRWPGEVPGKSHDMTSIVRFNIWMMLFIVLFFMAGRCSVAPRRAGVQEMPDYGCCAQGLAFPRRHLNMLSNKLRSPPYEMAGDSFIECIAAEQELKKWAMVPSVLQHAGARGTSAPGSRAKHTWSFSFESRT